MSESSSSDSSSECSDSSGFESSTTNYRSKKRNVRGRSKPIRRSKSVLTVEKKGGIAKRKSPSVEPSTSRKRGGKSFPDSASKKKSRKGPQTSQIEHDLSTPGTYRDFYMDDFSCFLGDDWYVKCNRFNSRNYVALRKFDATGKALPQGATLPISMLDTLSKAVALATKHVKNYKP